VKQQDPAGGRIDENFWDDLAQFGRFGPPLVLFSIFQQLRSFFRF